LNIIISYLIISLYLNYIFNPAPGAGGLSRKLFLETVRAALPCSLQDCTKCKFLPKSLCSAAAVPGPYSSKKSKPESAPTSHRAAAAATAGTRATLQDRGPPLYQIISTVCYGVEIYLNAVMYHSSETLISIKQLKKY
jgi:hypothetical protein